MISDWIEDEQLTVCVDFSDLGSFLAVEPTRTLGEDTAVHVDWLPLAVGVDSYPGQTRKADPDDPLAEYKARRGRAREQYYLRELERNCDLLDLSVTQASRKYDYTVARLGMLWVRKCKMDPGVYIREAFELAYRQDLTVDDPANIENLLDRCNIPANGFSEYCESAGPTELESLQTVLMDEGIFRSPGYLYKGECFLGREHLPLIRWYLSGQKGPPPV